MWFLGFPILSYLQFSVLPEFVCGFAVLDDLFVGFAVSNISQCPPLAKFLILPGQFVASPLGLLQRGVHEEEPLSQSIQTFPWVNLSQSRVFFLELLSVFIASHRQIT